MDKMDLFIQKIITSKTAKFCSLYMPVAFFFMLQGVNSNNPPVYFGLITLFIFTPFLTIGTLYSLFEYKNKEITENISIKITEKFKLSLAMLITGLLSVIIFNSGFSLEIFWILFAFFIATLVSYLRISNNNFAKSIITFIDDKK